RKQQPWNTKAFDRTIAFHRQLAKKVKAHQCKHHNPERNVYIAIQESPVISLIGNAEEFQRKGKFKKSQSNFYRVQPAPRLGHALDPFRKDCKQRKWYRKGERITEHSQYGL